MFGHTAQFDSFHLDDWSMNQNLGSPPLCTPFMPSGQEQIEPILQLLGSIQSLTCQISWNIKQMSTETA